MDKCKYLSAVLSLGVKQVYGFTPQVEPQPPRLFFTVVFSTSHQWNRHQRQVNTRALMILLAGGGRAPSAQE